MVFISIHGPNWKGDLWNDVFGERNGLQAAYLHINLALCLVFRLGSLRSHSSRTQRYV